ncbi:hypothetical protein SK128_013175 [Halocaridina rubra]|uniref:Uncharacterized protein n=1 Tax=Halocaridina rubra TaxID=373956 RepID=A0AAN8WZH7_HALRR
MRDRFQIILSKMMKLTLIVLLGMSVCVMADSDDSDLPVARTATAAKDGESRFLGLGFNLGGGLGGGFQGGFGGGLGGGFYPGFGGGFYPGGGFGYNPGFGFGGFGGYPYGGFHG